MSDNVSPAGMGPRGDWSPISTHIVRSICNPTGSNESPHELTFSISADVVRQTSGPEIVALIGEIQASNVAESHFLAATALLALAFDGTAPDLSNEKDYREFLEFAAKWGCHLLWDYTVAHVRSLASGLQHPEIDLPVATPMPTLLKRGGMNPLDPADEEDLSDSRLK